MCRETPPLVCQLPPSTEAPTFARDLVARNLCREHALLAELPAQMLVSELVAYAVVYGAPPFELTVTCEERELRIAVNARWLPEPAVHPVDEEGSADLRDRIIHKVARDWGVDRADDHATYWCTLPTGAMPRQRSDAVTDVARDGVH